MTGENKPFSGGGEHIWANNNGEKNKLRKRGI